MTWILLNYDKSLSEAVKFHYCQFCNFTTDFLSLISLYMYFHEDNLKKTQSICTEN